jgi:hypothetical protein
MGTLHAYSTYEARHVDPVHEEIGRRILTFVEDMGEDAEVILEFESPEEEFSFLFSGSNRSLLFANEGIVVQEFDLDTTEVRDLQTFEAHQLNPAILWLLTQAS